MPQAFPFQAGFPRLEPRGAITFASPSVADITGDDQPDVLIGDASGCVWAWDSQGRLLPGFPWMTSGSCDYTPRINSSLAIGDVDGDGQPEIVAGTRGASNSAGQLGRIFVWNTDGSLLPGWPKEMEWTVDGEGQAEVVSVTLANVTGDTRLETVAGTSNNGTGDNIPNLYAWDVNGSLLAGYPTGYRTAGIYGQIGAADLTGDGYAEVITGRDQLYLHAYRSNGQYLPGWPVRTYVDPAHTDWATDLYMEFTQNAQAMGDLDGDETVEIVATGKVGDPMQGYAVTHSGVLVIEPDGQRRSGWTLVKLGGAPLADSFSPSQAPALADLDDDGKLEIVVALYDGTLRVYRENGILMWSYDYAQGQPLFGSEPVIGDVTGDGKLDILFGTYSPTGSANSFTRLHGLDAGGRPLDGFPLAFTHEGASATHGLRSAPTLADIDQDCDVEILAASQASTLYVWDLPAPYRPDRMPWATGRHDNRRSGALGSSTGAAAATVRPFTNDLPYKAYLPLITRCR